MYLKLNDTSTLAYRRFVHDNPGDRINRTRKSVIDSLISHFGECDYNNYNNTIRKPSMLIKTHILDKGYFEINNTEYNVDFNTKLHIIVSGFLYTLRNDTMHGSSISISKSSMANMATFANSYYAFLLLYYLTVMLFIYNNIADYDSNVYDELAENILDNTERYKKLFGKHLNK